MTQGNPTLSRPHDGGARSNRLQGVSDCHVPATRYDTPTGKSTTTVRNSIGIQTPPKSPIETREPRRSGKPRPCPLWVPCLEVTYSYTRRVSERPTLYTYPLAGPAATTPETDERDTGRSRRYDGSNSLESSLRSATRRCLLNVDWAMSSDSAISSPERLRGHWK